MAGAGEMKVVMYGSQGWIGGQLMDAIKADGKSAVAGKVRLGLAPTAELTAELRELGATHVVCSVGRTHGGGCPNIDYLESGGPERLRENVQDNLYGPIQAATVCRDLGIHITYFGTGCIFTNTGKDGDLASESDLPTFFGSSYSVVKGFTDRMMHDQFDGSCLNLRIRMPIEGKGNSRDLLSKLQGYSNICDHPNSVTCLTEFMPIIIQMMCDKTTGTLNLTNPGGISPFGITEIQAEVQGTPHKTAATPQVILDSGSVKAGRSNCVLETKRLEELFPGKVKGAEDAVRHVVSAMPKVA